MDSDDGKNAFDAEFCASIWSVWRRDDNGNVFLVKSGLTEDDALRLVREFEAKGHKQTYWVTKASKALGGT
jgi:hypothetical protein